MGFTQSAFGEGLLFRSLRRLRAAAIFLGGLGVDALWKARDGRAEFALADLCAKLSILRKTRQIKSPNSGSRTPRNSQKTKNRPQLKSPKISILRNQKFRRDRIIYRESQRISTRLARRGGLAQSAFREGFGLHKRISNRFCPTNRIRRNSLKTKDRDTSNRF
jgi:hypothetical protein